MRNYTADKYTDLVENIDDETLQGFMRDEQSFIAGVEDLRSRTVVDLGAGHGRVVPFLSSAARDVIAIEINPDMHRGLAEVSANLLNVEVTQGNFLHLGDLLTPDVHRPVFLILQNSLGTIEGGDAKQVLDVVRQEAAKRNGELVLALLRAQALAKWGVSMYQKLEPMVGAIDYERSDLKNGNLATRTGYTSHWWTDNEIESFKSLGKVVREFRTDQYAFVELNFDKD